MRVIYCAGDQGAVVLDILRYGSTDTDIAFGDDDPSKHGEDMHGVPVVGGIESVVDCDDEVTCLVAFGARRGVRLDIARRLDNVGLDFFNAVHPDTTVSDAANIGAGVTINARSYIGPTVDIGDHVLVDSCVNISHDTRIGDGATITPGAVLAGGVDVGEDSYIGPGATVFKGIDVGANAVVGGGAVVSDDVADGTTVTGVPATPIDS